MESNYSAFIQEMTNMILRPQRDTYLTDKLGSNHLIIKSKTMNYPNTANTNKYIQVVRKDRVIQNKSQKIQMSYFTPIETVAKLQKGQQVQSRNNLGQSRKKCVIYLHANSGSRIQGLELVKYILPYEWRMAIFDYRGSGISEGQYTSMGVNQAQDLQKVMQYLSTYQEVGEFSLWGRSMGAVTILYYLTKQYFSNYKNGIIINNIVLDSPFSNMRKLMYQIGASNVGLPEFVFLPVVNSITEKLVAKMGFNLIAQLDLVARIRGILQKYPEWGRLISKINCLFLTSTLDKLVNHSHVQILHHQFPFFMKQLHYFNGQHNQIRTDSLKFKCVEFLCMNTNKSINEEYKIGNTPYFKIEMTRSEISIKENNLVFNDSKRQSQINEQNIQKNDQYSPKQIKIPVNFRKEQQKLEAKPPKSTLSSFMHTNQQKTEQNKSSIIINNNYNVNVNVFSKGQLQIVPEVIPPINFKEQGGSMTDRLSDNHNFNFKFYIPYTAKVQRKNYDQHNFSNVSNVSNVSNISNSSKNSSPLHSSTFLEAQTVTQKQGLFHSAKIENAPKMFQASNKPQLKEWSGPQQAQSFILQRKQQISQKNQIQIPLIKFDQMEANTSKLQSASHRVDKNIQNQPKIFYNSPKAGDFFVTKKDPQNSQKQKLSLSELRKIQKQVQQKSHIKSSKIIYVKKQKLQKDHELLYYKKQDIFQQIETYKYNSQQYNIEEQRSRHSKEMKSMKTSLMAKRKIYDRKNSDNINLNNMKHSLLKKQNPVNQQKIQSLNNQGVNSQKTLLYKIKIDHL